MITLIHERMKCTSVSEPLDLWASEVSTDDPAELCPVRNREKYDTYFATYRPGDALPDDIPMNIFGYVLAGYVVGQLTCELSNEQCRELFGMYQQVMYDVVYARRYRIEIHDFRIFDFDNYPSVLKLLETDLHVHS